MKTEEVRLPLRHCIKEICTDSYKNVEYVLQHRLWLHASSTAMVLATARDSYSFRLTSTPSRRGTMTVDIPGNSETIRLNLIMDCVSFDLPPLATSPPNKAWPATNTPPFGSRGTDFLNASE